MQESTVVQHGERVQFLADSPNPRFAHASEREFANILSFYQVEWRYEPRAFPVRWNADGRPIEMFTPDFYLPELDLYVELTTVRQSLVTKKNRKLRLLRELHPDLNIRLFYSRDVRNLLAKYGRAGLFVEPVGRHASDGTAP